MPSKEPQSMGEIVLYQAEDGKTRIECRFANENIWLTQRLLAKLFQIGVNTVNHHIKEILADGELTPDSTIRNYRIVQTEGTRAVERQVEHYILTHAGRIEKMVADKLAEDEYDQFHARRLSAEDEIDAKAFDEAIKKLPTKKPRGKKT